MTAIHSQVTPQQEMVTLLQDIRAILYAILLFERSRATVNAIESLESDVDALLIGVHTRLGA